MKKTLSAHLSKLNITEMRYVEESGKLLNAGFSEEEAKKLILQKWSFRTVAAVLEHAERLSAAPYFLTKAEIVQIAAHSGGSKNIEAVRSSFTALQALSFSAEQIVKMSGHDGGSNNIKAVQSSFAALQALGFSAEQIVKMSGHDGGSKNIKAVQSSFAALQVLGFTADQMVKMSGHGGGSRNIAAVLSSFAALQVLGFSPDQVVQMSGNDGGSKSIEAVLSSFTALQGLRLSSEQIVKMIAHNSGSKSMEAVLSSFIALQDLGFTADQMVKMSAYGGGSLKLQAVIDYYPRLQLRGYTTDWMVSLVIRASSLNEIKKQAEKCLTYELPEELPADDGNPILDGESFEWPLALEEEESDIAHTSCFEPSEIRCTGKRDNPFSQDPSAEYEPISLSEALLRENSLLESSRNEDAERSDSISPETSTSELIRQGVAHLEHLSRLNIPEHRYNDERLKLLNAGFSEEEAKKLILRIYSSPTVAVVLEHAERLSDSPYFLTKAQIVQIAAHSGGSINIEAVLSSFEALQVLGFSADQIVKMSAHNGGSKNIKAVQASFAALRDLGFTADQIVKMIAHGGGSKNIEAVRSSFTALQDLGFSADQMVKMSGHHGGSLKLQAVIDYYPRLQGHGYTIDRMVALVRRARSSKKIKEKEAEMCFMLELSEFLGEEDNTSLNADLCDFLLALEKEDRDIADPSCGEPSEIRCTGKRSAEDEPISLIEPLLEDNGSLKRSRNEDRESFDPIPFETSTFGLIPSEKGRSLSFFSAASASADEENDLYYCPNESAFTL